MGQEWDIFISYKNDGEGNNFAARLSAELKGLGYVVFYNPEEHHAGSFPDRLREAVESCTDFILIVTKGCLEQLIRYDKVDWIREELMTAYKNGKNIIPLLMPGVDMPKDKDDMPKQLRFLPDTDAVKIYDADTYNVSSLDILLKIWIKSEPYKDIYTNVSNNNPYYDVQTDFLQTLSKANNGNIEAMYEVANMYFYGFTDENNQSARSFSKAYEWFKRISETQNEYTCLAESMIAKMYYRGVVPREKQSFIKALEYHKKAAKISEASKQQYAFMLSTGLGCDFDFEVAERQYLSSIENGDTVCIGGLAQLYIKFGFFLKAAEVYKRMMDVYPDAAYELGLLYSKGVLNSPPKPDYYKAAFYFQHAIEKEYQNVDVFYQLGLLYFRAVGGFVCDYRIAQNNFKIAADKGHVGAQYMMGYMYEHGHVAVDIGKAIYYHKLAADNGSILSPTHLSILYQLPEYQNYQKAFYYAKMAAEKGEKEGEFIYGNLLFFGRGCEANMEKAYEAYKSSYEHGFDQALFMIRKILQLQGDDF